MAGIALLCGACVFAASMTSEANRTYFVNSVRYLVGDDTRIIVYNDETNDSDSMEENKAIEDIENKLEIEMPEFCYRPYELRFLNYEIDKDITIAKMEFQYKDSRIVFLIDKQDESTASKISSMHGHNIETIETSGDGILVKIEEVKDQQEEESSLTAQWERNNVLFYLSGKIEVDEMRKIVEQIKY